MVEAMPQMDQEDAPASIGEAKDRVVEEAKETASDVREQGRTKLQDQLDERSTEIGHQLGSVGSAFGEAAQRLRDEGDTTAADLTERLASKVGQLGAYLEHSDGERLLRDLEDLGRRQPMAAAAGGLLLGFAGSRFLKASSARRAASSAEDSWGGPVDEWSTTSTPPMTTAVGASAPPPIPVDGL